MFFRDVEMEIRISGGSEGVVAASLPTQKMSKSLSGEKFRGVEDGVLQQVSQTWGRDKVL